VGVRTAEAVAAVIDDPDRFGDAKAVGRYFGLVPSQDQSETGIGWGTSHASPLWGKGVPTRQWTFRFLNPVQIVGKVVTAWFDGKGVWTHITQPSRENTSFNALAAN
jgi:hypothetical protein